MIEGRRLWVGLAALAVGCGGGDRRVAQSTSAEEVRAAEESPVPASPVLPLARDVLLNTRPASPEVGGQAVLELYVLGTDACVRRWSPSVGDSWEVLGCEIDEMALYLPGEAESALCGLAADGGVRCWDPSGVETEMFSSGNVDQFRWGRTTGCVHRREDVVCAGELPVTAGLSVREVELIPHVVCVRGFDDSASIRVVCTHFPDGATLLDTGRRGCALDSRFAFGTSPQIVVECDTATWTVAHSGSYAAGQVERVERTWVREGGAGRGTSCDVVGRRVNCSAESLSITRDPECPWGFRVGPSPLVPSCGSSGGAIEFASAVARLDYVQSAACVVLASGTVECWGSAGGDVSAELPPGLVWREPAPECASESRCADPTDIVHEG